MYRSTQVSRLVVQDNADTFDLLVIEGAEARSLVLFAVGAGGSPERHLPFLNLIAAQGCKVVAPSFAKLASAIPTVEELSIRIRRLQLAVETMKRPDIPLAGVGHSIGATLLLVMAGAEASTFSGDTVKAPAVMSLLKLALMAPPTQFFRGAGALANVRSDTKVWVGQNDEITPPPQAFFLDQTLCKMTSVHVQLVPEAGHFSFMNVLPPHVTDSMSDRENFLKALAEQIGRFATS